MTKVDKRTPAEAFKEVLDLHVEHQKKKIIQQLVIEFNELLIDAASKFAIDLEEYYSVSGDGRNINISLRLPNITLPVKKEAAKQKTTEE